jgi:hypothetical protein
MKTTSNHETGFTAMNQAAGPVPGRYRHGEASWGRLPGLGVLFVDYQGGLFSCGYLPVKYDNMLSRAFF